MCNLGMPGKTNAQLCDTEDPKQRIPYANQGETTALAARAALQRIPRVNQAVGASVNTPNPRDFVLRPWLCRKAIFILLLALHQDFMPCPRLCR